MLTLRHHRTVLLLVFAFILSAAVFNIGTEKGTTQDLHKSPLPLAASTRDRIIAHAFVRTLESLHISQRTLNSSVSKEAFRMYIKSLDQRKLFFYQSDIDEFKTKYEMKLCDFLKPPPGQSVDMRPAFEIYNRYLIRLKERVAMVQKILLEPIDFTVDEEYTFDKSSDFTLDENVVQAKGLQTFPQTTEEAYDRWRKRIKSELLSLKSESLANERKRERDIAEGKEPEELDDRDPVERLQRRYASLQRRMLFEGRFESTKLLEDVRKQANDDVTELFLNAVARALDPHSGYMNPATEESFGMDMGKSFHGIGATLSSEEDGYIVVVDVMKGSPAERAEIRPKDKIQGVGQGKDGHIEEVVDFKVTDVVKLIRGEGGTTVRLDILPGGKGPSKIVEIVRAEITLDDKAAKGEIFESGMKTDGTPYKIGFIKLPNFYLDMEAARRHEANVRSATTDLKKILKMFVEANVDAVVLDLRFNGGGSLSEAIELTGLFLGAGVVVQTKDEMTNRPQPRANPDNSCDWTGPFVVVTNKLSASASEIFSGAIKDYKRGLVVGDSSSLGKGTVQSLIDLGHRLLVSGEKFGSGKITIQGFYRPSGITTQKIGVDADVILPSRYDVHEGMKEADLDNALTLQRVPAANYTPKQYVTPQIVTELRRRSGERVRESEDFTKELEKMTAYKEIRARRSTPLNEAKYLEEIKRFDTDEWDREEVEEILSRDKKIDRDYYVDEVLAITVDYVKVMEEQGIQFPTERTVQPAPPRRGFFSGLRF